MRVHTRKDLALFTAVIAALLAALSLVSLPARAASADWSKPAWRAPDPSFILPSDLLVPAASATALPEEATALPEDLVFALDRRTSFSPSPSGAATLASVSRMKLPRDLVRLERKMRLLHINSERVSMSIFVTGVHLRHGGSLFESVRSKRSRGKHRPKGQGRKVERHVAGKRHRHAARKGGRTPLLVTSQPTQTIPLVTANGEVSVSPKLAVIRGRVLGAIPFQLRVIGEQSWERSPLLASKDGGRPWVYTSPAERAEERAKAKSGSSPIPQLGGTESSETGFGKLIHLLATARSVVEVGRRTVDGQKTTEFELRLDPRRLLPDLAPRRPKRGNRRLAKRMRKLLRHTKLTLDLFLAPSGLPVRMRVDLQRGKVGFIIAGDILATEIPVSVQPPPASETITKAELKKLLEQEAGSLAQPPHLTKRQRAEGRRFNACMRRHLDRRRKPPRHRVFERIFRECEKRAKRVGTRPRKSKQ